MAHPSDAALRITLGRHLHEQLNSRVANLIRSPTERTAGYIQALHDVLRFLEGDEVVIDYAETTIHPTQERQIG